MNKNDSSFLKFQKARNLKISIVENIISRAHTQEYYKIRYSKSK